MFWDVIPHICASVRKCSPTYGQVIFFNTNICAAAGVVVVQTVVLREHVYKVNWSLSDHYVKHCNRCEIVYANIDG